jgi:hypothetical protein
MNSSADKNLYTIHHGAHIDTKSDLYRAKHGFPLNESPERFLAARTQVRKNKDYRPRFRSFFIGFPVYKKDNYTRHWYNLIDIIQDKESPIMKYTKRFMKGCFISFLYYGLEASYDMADGGRLRERKVNISKDYSKKTIVWDDLRKTIKFHGRKMAFQALGLTVWFIVFDYLRKHADLSMNKSCWISALILSPPLLFIMKDKLIPQFWAASFLLAIGMCKNFLI